MAELRARQRERQPVRLRGAAVAGSRNNTNQPLFSRLWGSGFLPSSYQGVRFSRWPRAGALSRGPAPNGGQTARHDAVAKLNQMKHDATTGDPEIEPNRAVRDGVPDADVGAGPDGSLEGAQLNTSIGPESRKPERMRRTACRRAAERDVRFIQLYHRGWDMHTTICRATLRCSAKGPISPQAALVADLKQRGLLDDTLVVGASAEHGVQPGQADRRELRRDRHPRNFCMWVAARQAGACSARPTTSATTPRQIPYRSTTCKPSTTCSGSKYTKLTYRFQGRETSRRRPWRSGEEDSGHFEG